MKKYIIDFSASMLIEAENAEQAQEKFWQNTLISPNLDYIEIGLVEECND